MDYKWIRQSETDKKGNKRASNVECALCTAMNSEGLNNNFLRLFYFSFVFITAPHQLTIHFDALHLSAVSSVGGEREKEVNLLNSEFGHIWLSRNWTMRDFVFFFIYNSLPWTIHTTEAREKFQLGVFFFIPYICIQLLVMLSIHAIIRFYFFHCSFQIFGWCSMFQAETKYCAAPGPCSHAMCVLQFVSIYFRSNDSHMLWPIANTQSDFWTGRSCAYRRRFCFFFLWIENKNFFGDFTFLHKSGNGIEKKKIKRLTRMRGITMR